MLAITITLSLKLSLKAIGGGRVTKSYRANMKNTKFYSAQLCKHRGKLENICSMSLVQKTLCIVSVVAKIENCLFPSLVMSDTTLNLATHLKSMTR